MSRDEKPDCRDESVDFFDGGVEEFLDTGAEELGTGPAGIFPKPPFPKAFRDVERTLARLVATLHKEKDGTG